MRNELPVTIQLNPQRIGFGSTRGVPDIIVWIIIRINDKNRIAQYPLLIELEKAPENAIEDFQKYAKRSISKEKCSYFSISIQSKTTSHLNLKTKYHIQSIISSSLGEMAKFSEGECYAHIKHWSTQALERKYFNIDRIERIDKPNGYYKWLDNYQPVARAGKSIFIYHIEIQPLVY